MDGIFREVVGEIECIAYDEKTAEQFHREITALISRFDAKGKTVIVREGNKVIIYWERKSG